MGRNFIDLIKSHERMSGGYLLVSEIEEREY
nr:MAG TPA: hypothetical protein [Caudoviricetes sp.]